MKYQNELRAIVTEHFGPAKRLAELTQEDFIQLYQFIGIKKQQLLLSESFNSYFSNPAYTRLVLVEGLVRIMLREIAPKRMKKANHGKK